MHCLDRNQGDMRASYIERRCHFFARYTSRLCQLDVNFASAGSMIQPVRRHGLCFRLTSLGRVGWWDHPCPLRPRAKTPKPASGFCEALRQSTFITTIIVLVDRGREHPISQLSLYRCCQGAKGCFILLGHFDTDAAACTRTRSLRPQDL